MTGEPRELFVGSSFGPSAEFLCATSKARLPVALDKRCNRTTCLSKAVEVMGLGLLGIPSPASFEQEARMFVTSYADDLGSAVHYALETTHAIAICPFHLDLTIRIGDDAAEATPLRVPESSSKAMARRGREKLFGKNLDANSAKRLTVTVLTAPFWVTQSYKKATGFRLRRILCEAARSSDYAAGRQSPFRRHCSSAPTR